MQSELGIKAEQARLRLRQIHRAASDLRRGVPVVLDGPAPLLVLAAETAGVEGLAEREAISGGPLMLILARARPAAILRKPMPAQAEAVAVSLPPFLRNIPIFQSLVDPTVKHPAIRAAVEVEVDAQAATAALALAKIGRLLPAVLAVPLPQDLPASLAEHGLLRVPAAAVLDYASHEIAGLRQIVAAHVPLTDAPDSQVVAFRTDGSAVEHLAIVIGNPLAHPAPLVRVHSECFTGDLLGSMR